MNGHVDAQLRALIEVDVRVSSTGQRQPVQAWIDTAFNGQFVFPRHLIEQLQLQQQSAAEAILADGQRVTLESYACDVDWFGEQATVQVIANDGQMPLLGTEMLAERRLLIDYRQRELSLD